MKYFLILFILVICFSMLFGQTSFMTGDIAVVGINANNNSCGGTGGDDFVSFVCFKDITTGTTLDITDNGYERSFPGLWGDTEGTYRATRTGGTIFAGTVITFKTGSFSCIYPDTNWTFNSINGGWNSFNLNSGGDQLFFMQNGVWSGYTDTIDNNATYFGGNILFGFNTKTTWAANGTTQQSNLPPNMNCFSMTPTSGTDFVKYTGPTTPTTQKAWILRISTQANWTKYTSCALYNSALPDYSAGVTFLVTEFFNVDAGLNDTACQNQVSFALGGTPPGGYWTGIGITDTTAGLFDPSTSGAGNFYVTYIYNDAGCLYHDLKTVVINPMPVITINSGLGETCAGTDLNITSSLSSGTAPFSQLWSGDTPYINNTSILNPVFNSSSTGNYNLTLTVTDSKGCIGASSISVQVNPNPTVTIFPSSLQVCANTDTNLTATPAGGSLTYSTHLWTGSTSILTSSLNQPNVTLNSGTDGNFSLTYTVTDNKGCIGSSFVSVIVNPIPIITITLSQQTICSETTTNIILSSDITGTTYSWSVVQLGVSGASAGNDTIIAQTITNSGTTDGTATYTITPTANSCSGIAENVIITVNPLPVVTVTPTLQSICSGSITSLSLSSSVTNTFYVWTVTQSGVTGASADSGMQILQTLYYSGSQGTATYAVTGTSNSCVGSATNVIVTVNPQPEINLVTKTDVSICGGNDGTISITASGFAPLTYSIDNGINFSNDSTFSGLLQGNYTIIVKNGYGCTISYTNNPVIIGVTGAPPAPVAGINAMYCQGQTAINLSATANNGGSLTWFSNSGLTIQIGTGVILDPNPFLDIDTNIFYVIESVNGCISNPATVTIIINTLPVLLVTVSNILCFGENNGSANVTVSGDTSGYNFLWSPGGFTTPNITNLSSGTYNVIVNDINGCAATATASITQPVSALSISITPTDGTCGNSNGSINTITIGGTPPYSYFWSNNQIGSIATYLSAGTHQVTVTDINDCIDSSSAFIFIPDAIQLTIDTSKNITSCQDNADGSLIVSVSGGVIPYSYLWSDGSSNKDIFNLSKGEYTITITDSLNCSVSKIFEIKSKSAECLEIPNAFTPNNDGNNDTWEIKHIELYPKVRVEIYNRWGNLIFVSDGYSQPWDGQYNDVEVTTGSYIYIINLNNGSEAYKGAITVIR